MVSDGKVKTCKNNDMGMREGSLCERITGSLGRGAALIMVLVISATLLAIMPVGANLIAEPAPSAAVDQPSGCPCSGGCSTEPTSQDSQVDKAEMESIIQDAQPDNTPVNTIQQPVDSTPAVTAGTVAINEPARAGSESANTNSIAEMVEPFSSARLIQAMPSWWLNSEQGSDTLYNIFDKKLDAQPSSFGTVLNGWQKGSFGMFSPLFAS